ncbi:hypothetical protein CKK33_01820 [Mucilaginibacter sp. MD40]|uniref:hypothetical protein n=1 Tax=Mucilaginibacter sp. MD40 TaxID=2029590 RepID=UPI000BAC4FB3|nr:hypothetical protein [Mucilaginibacter sp. MD40]PAW92296.1 hypothetical protein CKK33_01820 [Mucilaginibacter sp. MD40]
MIKRKAKRRLKPILSNERKKGFGYELPPCPHFVDIYFDQKGLPEQAQIFFKYYDDLSWQSPAGTPYKNWKVLAAEWIFNHRTESGS